jgi:hypothetical protein
MLKHRITRMSLALGIPLMEFSGVQQNCPVHKCRCVRTLIPRTNLDPRDHVWITWKNAFPANSYKNMLKKFLVNSKNDELFLK